MAKIDVNNLYKIFGSNPEKVFSLLEDGLNKDQILEKIGNTVGVNNVSFSVNNSEIFVLMGLSGSGKSTLIRCLNRLIEPSRGEIIVDGKNILKMNSDQLLELRRNKFGMVFQNFGLFPHRTILKNVEYGLEIQGVEKAERKKQALESLELVGLKDWSSYKPENLSGGMQQRVGLARALALDPDILLMDEPFSALDPLIKREMQKELIDLQSELQKTIIFITHDLDEALKVGDKIGILNKEGRIVQIGRPEEILSNPANDYVEEFVSNVNRINILNAEDVMFSPDGLININDGPHMALRIMEKEGISSVYVVDREKKVAGIITDKKAIKARENNEDCLKDYLVKDYPETSPDTPLNELLPLASEAKFPIAVTDKENKLQGIIVRVSVLSSLIEGSDIK